VLRCDSEQEAPSIRQGQTRWQPSCDAHRSLESLGPTPVCCHMLYVSEQSGSGSPAPSPSHRYSNPAAPDFPLLRHAPPPTCLSEPRLDDRSGTRSRVHVHNYGASTFNENLSRYRAGTAVRWQGEELPYVPRAGILNKIPWEGGATERFDRQSSLRALPWKRLTTKRHSGEYNVVEGPFEAVQPFGQYTYRAFFTHGSGTVVLT